MPKRKEKHMSKIIDAATHEEVRFNRVQRFVVPDTTTIQLSGGDWIEIKNELTYGEQEDLNSAGLRSMRRPEDGEAEITLQWNQFNTAKIAMWLADWSFRDEKDRPVQINRENIRNLTNETAQEILAAIEEHQANIEAKKGGTPTSLTLGSGMRS
jgi:hypothetical protein